MQTERLQQSQLAQSGTYSLSVTGKEVSNLSKDEVASKSNIVQQPV